MSIDYSFCFFTETNPEEVLASLKTVQGVQNSDGVWRIQGLGKCLLNQLSVESQRLFREDSGKHCVEVNWELTGKHDKETDVLDLTDRLFQCAAKLKTSFPEMDFLLAVDGHRYYVRNRLGALMISPLYLEAIPAISDYFDCPFEIEDMSVH